MVLYDAHLGVHIVLHAVVITIQVVRRDIKQDGYIRVEIIHVVQLEATQLYHVILMRRLRHLQGKALADIASQPHIVARGLKNMVDKRSCRGLAIAARNADHLRRGISTREFYLADDMSSLLHQLLHDGSLLRDAWAFDDFVRVKDFVLCMLAFFPFYAMQVEQLLVCGLDA